MTDYRALAAHGLDPHLAFNLRTATLARTIFIQRLVYSLLARGQYRIGVHSAPLFDVFFPVRIVLTILTPFSVLEPIAAAVTGVPVTTHFVFQSPLINTPYPSVA